jgi:hypothetical protein
MPADEMSLRRHTDAIRHLDAERARELVAVFARPVVGGEGGLAYDPGDPIEEATKGWLTLERPADRDDSADVVGQYSTHLFLQGLLRLPLSVARELARHRGHLYLAAVPSITDGVAAELSRHRGGGLALNGIRRLSGTSARLLGLHGGELSLDRLRSISPVAAQGLAQHENELYLRGLRRLSAAAAAALSLHRGDLFLKGLATLPARVATHLARHRGKLHVHGVALLSNAAAEAFGGRQGYLCLQGVRRLTPAQAGHLAGHRGPLLFDALELDDAVADCLGRHEGSLAVNVRAGIETASLESLMRHVGQVVLTGLAAIDERQARVLAAQANWHGVEGLSGLFLDSIERVTPAVAAILATHRAGGLSLNGIRLLTEDTARQLVGHPLLCLDGVSTLTDRIAGILASHSGVTLSLQGLQTLTPAALAKLRGNPGIELPKRFRVGAAGGRAAASAGPRRPSEQELIRVIERIAGRGEESLRP